MEWYCVPCAACLAAISIRNYRDFTLLNNALLGTVLLGAVGVIAYSLREVPATLIRWLSRYFMSSVVVDSRDRYMFTTLLEHLERLPGFANANQITAHSRRLGVDDADSDPDLAAGIVPEVHASPAPGFHMFRAYGRRLLVHRELQVSQSVFESVTLSCFGRDPAVLRTILSDAVSGRLERESRRLAIYIPDSYSSGEWMRTRVGNRRPLSSVILREGVVEDLRADLESFFEGQAKYARLGIPWRRGYLLYGPPGTGKTSLVTALASDLQLNICTFSLASPIITDEKIHALLASIPRRSILLIEDVDAFFNQREAVHDEVKLSFAGFLNALDGVATQEGSVLFMTTNHPERLDPALIRSGRVDRKVELGLADAEQMRRIFLRFKDDPAEADAFVAQYKDREMSPADLQALLMSRYMGRGAQ